MAMHRSVGTFEDRHEGWTSYTKSLQQYFTANHIKMAEKQRAILLSVCGATTYKPICNLTAPGKLTDHTFQQLVQLLQSHRTLPLLVTVQWFTFNTRSQKEGKTVTQFEAELRVSRNTASLRPYSTICSGTGWCAESMMFKFNADCWLSHA